MAAAIRVLYVDDEPDLLDIGKIYLERFEDLAVTTINNAPDAIRLLEQEKFDAIISDYQMPGMNGIQFLVEVRKRFGPVPFILFTGRGREEVVIQALNSGADFYLQKGGEPKSQFAELSHKIKAAVQSVRAEDELLKKNEELAASGEELKSQFDSLAESDRTNRFLVEQLVMSQEIGHTGSWLYNVVTDTTWGSAEAHLLFGFPPVAGDFPMADKESCIPERERVHQVLADLISAGKEYNLEYVIHPRDGSAPKVIHSIARLEKDAQGNPIRVVGVYQDISDRKKAETALAQSEERNRTVLENVPDLILVHRNGVILYTNPSSTEIMGYTPDELNNKPLVDFFVPEFRPIVAQAISRRMAGEIVEPYEIEILTKSGERRTVVVRGCLIEFDGSPASLNVFTDITERKMAENALKKNSTLLNDVCEMGHVGGWELDVTTKEVLWTKETYRIHEISEDEKIDLSKAIHFYDIPGRSTLEEALQRCMGKGESFDLELTFTTANGNHLWIRAMGHAVYKEGTVVKLTGTFQDITERKTAEESMKTISEDLDRKVLERTSDLRNINLNLTAEIGIRLDAEKELTKTVGQKEVLLREVHHRVKNNLQIIISLLNLQSRYIKDDTTRLAFLESQSRVRAMALVHEKLYQSKDLAKMDLGNYLKFLGDNLFQFLGMKGKGITLTMDIRDVFLAIDTAIPIGLMINELISNSLKYAFPEGRTGEISLAIHRQDHMLTILFKDNGVGIPDGFDWRNTQSMGFQLITALVDQLDGTIELDQTSGTQFTIVVMEKK
jgi:PAS domain S-box-containing protein